MSLVPNPESVKSAPRFSQTYCSQCGGEFGPGNSGFSHCDLHQGLKEMGRCEDCDGSGRVVETVDVDVPGHNRAGSYDITVTCDACGGEGRIAYEPDDLASLSTNVRLGL